jgi:dTDP-4-dehydrorhamnose reductase
MLDLAARSAFPAAMARTESRWTEGATLVLGGSGFLGAHVVATALARSGTGASVYSASREPSRTAGDARAVEFDALREGGVDAIFREIAPKRVVLCTALAKIEDCEAYPELARTLNVELPRRVAVACAEIGARLVAVSTDLVFGGGTPRAGGYVEEDPTAPVSHYGATKALGEDAVVQSNANALVVRVPLLFGPSGGRGRGASDGLLAAIARGEKPRLFTDEWRTPLSVVEAAAALCELLDSSVTGRLHVAGPHRISRYDLGLWALRVKGLPPNLIEPALAADLGTKSLRPADACLDARKARSLLDSPLSGAGPSVDASGLV